MSAQELARLVDEAGFVFRGRVVARTSAVDAPASTVQIEEVLHATDVLRGLAGTDATVVGEHAAGMQPGEVHVFFTHVVSLGEHLVAREVARREASPGIASDVAEGVRIAAERPLAERLAEAEMVVAGRVTSTRPVGRDDPPSSEHDPLWSVARVSVEDVMKGPRSRKTVEVLFASSRDIAWRDAPKLEEGDSGVFVLHRRGEEAPDAVAAGVFEATHPLDVLPNERRADAERLIEGS
jgi:hypothetical protein